MEIPIAFNYGEEVETNSGEKGTVSLIRIQALIGNPTCEIESEFKVGENWYYSKQINKVIKSIP